MSAPTTDAASADPAARVERAFRDAIAQVLGGDFADADPVVKRSGKPELGDFQVNGAMALAKRAKTNPRELAAKLVEAADVDAIAEPPEVAGPGFINVRLKASAIADGLDAMSDARLGVAAAEDTRPVVVDMCAVNVAKQAHVGHLRSSIIGDAMARILERRGRQVIRQNHLGDWGRPIAQVLFLLRQKGVDLDRLSLDELDAAYRDAQLTAKADARGLEAARTNLGGPHRVAELEAQNDGAAEFDAGVRRTLLDLQGGDAATIADWEKLIAITLDSLHASLDLLGVRLDRTDNRGESFYRDRLDGTVADLLAAGVAREDEDSSVVVAFEGREKPLVVRKKDGGYLYATTDLAAIRFRVTELGAGRVIYVVDFRQGDHFRDVFETAKRAGWTRTDDGREAELWHVGFGAVLGEDKRPLKTRSGANATLRSLIDEAIGRGSAEVRRRARDEGSPTHGLPPNELAAIGRAVGIGAIKYADLSSDLTRDYVFDMDRMIAFEGDTGPYLQYAHARICSILRKAADEGVAADAIAEAPFHLDDPAERALALGLLRHGEIIAAVAATLEPHRLCNALYDLAGAYSTFYQQCPVLKSEGATRLSRLRLCDLVRRVLADGLHLLGIDTPDRM